MGYWVLVGARGEGGWGWGWGGKEGRLLLAREGGWGRYGEGGFIVRRLHMEKTVLKSLSIPVTRKLEP